MKEIQLSFAITIRVERTDVNWLEAQLLEERERGFQQGLLTVLQQIEGWALAQGAPCGRCGGEWQANGRKCRILGTLLGTVRVERVRLRCAGGGAERYPLDEAVGLAGGTKHTLGVRERALWAATEVSDEKSERFLAKFAGLAVSRGTIHGLAREEGDRLLAQDTAERQAVFGGGQAPPDAERQPGTLFIQVDGTGVHNRATQTSMESTVGVLFSERARVARNRIELVDKRCVASFEAAEAFGETLWLAAVRQGVERRSGSSSSATGRAGSRPSTRPISPRRSLCWTLRGRGGAGDRRGPDGAPTRDRVRAGQCRGDPQSAAGRDPGVGGGRKAGGRARLPSVEDPRHELVSAGGGRPAAAAGAESQRGLGPVLA